MSKKEKQKEPKKPPKKGVRILRSILILAACAAGLIVFILMVTHKVIKFDTMQVYKIMPGQKQELSESSDFQIRELVGESTDYSKSQNWLSVSIPKYEVDTFFIYPTIVASDKMPDIISIKDSIMRIGAGATILKDAYVFKESTNLFVPVYRQSNLNALAPLRGAEVEEFQMQEQRTDIYGALDYYFEHYNGGRPFILAGHSQGSIMVKIVLEEYMQAHPDLYERMVAAYVIGYSVTKDDLEKYPHLKFAEGEDDTGVIISYNTEGPENKDADNIVVLENAISINPINWKRDETYAPASENLGSRVYENDEGEEYEEKSPGLADAQVDLERGVVICTNDELPVSDMGSKYDILGPQSYHKGDYTFYYYNLVDNVKKRVDKYLETHEATGYSIQAEKAS